MVVLCDTGILLRLFEPSELLHPAIRDAVHALVRTGAKLVTAPQNIAEFWNAATRPVTARGGFGLSLAAAEQRLQDIESTFAIL